MNIRLTTAACAALFALSMPTLVLAQGNSEAADLWKAKCKGCHGEDGKAKTKMGQKEKIDDFTNADWQKRHSDADIKRVIRDGSEKNQKMKAFGEKLTDQEIDALVKYIRTLK
jgi:mono/diheme cytochrome c family protein